MTITNTPKNFKHQTTGLCLVVCLFLLLNVRDANASVQITAIPQNTVLQGEPVLIQILGAKIYEIKKITFDKKTLNVFTYMNKPSTLLGIDLNKKIGDYKIYLELKNGSSSEQILTVKEREKYQTYLAVPEKLGGNSVSNQAKVVNTLADENAVLAVIKTFAKPLWISKFTYPLSNPVISDTYGFSRTSGSSAITHKGTDLKAKEGTKVVAMNKGIVRIARTFQVYGKTVVIDHGLGVMTFYLHLSKIKVNEGELVKAGQVIGLSGSTGFSTGPHLHFSVRINNVSIDPIKFLELFN